MPDPNLFPDFKPDYSAREKDTKTVCKLADYCTTLAEYGVVTHVEHLKILERINKLKLKLENSR